MSKLHEKRIKIVSFIQDLLKRRINVSILMGVMIVLCLVTYFVPIEIDFTRNKANSISREAKNIVRTLNVNDNDIKVMFFSAIANPDIDPSVLERVETVFYQLSKINKKIKYSIIDLDKNPDSLVEYQKAETNCILITYKDKSITIPYDEFVYVYDNVLEIDVEKVIIEELVKLKELDNYNIYYTYNHGERINNDEFSEFHKLINNLGYNLKEVDLSNELPTDVSNLYIMSPQYDFSEEEIIRLKNYVQRGNSLFIILSGTLSKDINGEYDLTPNLVKFYHDLGLNVSDKYIVDQIQDTKLIGVYSEDDEDALKIEALNQTVYMPTSRLFTISSLQDRYDIVETMISGELASYPLIVKLTNENTKVLVTASTEMFSNNYLNHNKIFITYLINWIDNYEDNINIKPFLYKEYIADSEEFGSALVLGIIEIMIPLCALYVGFEISRKRVVNTKSKIMK